jgi:hypothetical protein
MPAASPALALNGDELVAKEREAQAALQVTQARLRQALRLGNLFLLDVDTATGTRYEDDVARLLGYDATRPTDDALYAAAVHPDDREQERRAMDCTLSRAEDVYSCTYRLDCVDGVQRTVASAGSSTKTERWPISSGCCATSPKPRRSAPERRTARCSQSRWWAS